MTNDPLGPDPLNDQSRPSSTAEDFDQDALEADPLEEGMDPPENWTVVTRTGHDDVADDSETLDERLAEEEPDVFSQLDSEERSTDY